MAFQTHMSVTLSKLLETIPDAVKARVQAQPMQDNDGIKTDELTEIYLPLASLIHARVQAQQAVREQMAAALGVAPVHPPFLIGMAGSVAVGKSTAAQLMQRALASWPQHPDVALVTSDGFLFANAELERRGILDRKGFPESFDTEQLAAFLYRLKSGESGVTAPLYSHVTYDIETGRQMVLHAPQIVIIEGINVLQPQPSNAAKDHSIASDFLDFAIYVHADESLIRQWYQTRFLALTDAAAQDPASFYARFVALTPEQRLAMIEFVWSSINGKNLASHILPTRKRADLILHKGPDHKITHFELRNR
ncbi:MAG: type I pantothenate kinase [Pseudomonadota bacterium]